MRCYVIDDELFAATKIAALIERTPGLELVGVETDDEIALNKLLTYAIIADVIFLDVELKKYNGDDINNIMKVPKIKAHF